MFGLLCNLFLDWTPQQVSLRGLDYIYLVSLFLASPPKAFWRETKFWVNNLTSSFITPTTVFHMHMFLNYRWWNVTQMHMKSRGCLTLSYRRASNKIVIDQVDYIFAGGIGWSDMRFKGQKRPCSLTRECIRRLHHSDIISNSGHGYSGLVQYSINNSNCRSRWD